MSGVIVLWIVMIVLAAATFAPLGYFIYKFTQTNPKPFGETEPHGDSPSIINNFAEMVVGKIKGFIGGK
jgi:hypothetical protein